MVEGEVRSGCVSEVWCGLCVRGGEVRGGGGVRAAPRWEREEW